MTVTSFRNVTFTDVCYTKTRKLAQSFNKNETNYIIKHDSLGTNNRLGLLKVLRFPGKFHNFEKTHNF